PRFVLPCELWWSTSCGFEGHTSAPAAGQYSQGSPWNLGRDRTGTFQPSPRPDSQWNRWLLWTCGALGQS
ncbi:hypothetical protein GOODEAATRI_019620, partial [Goodea atripinnis]